MALRAQATVDAAIAAAPESGTALATVLTLDVGPAEKVLAAWPDTASQGDMETAIAAYLAAYLAEEETA